MNVRAQLTIGALILLAAAGLWVRASHAFEIEYTSEEYDLQSGEYEEQCKSADLTAALDQLKDNYAQRFLSSMQDDITASIKEFAIQYATCLATNILAGGSGISGAKTCAADVGGAMASQMKQEYLSRLENDFLDDCGARTALNDVLDASQAILAQNGRDGGPAFVQDWQQLQADSQYRGLQVARNQMANTDYCPWLR